MWRKWDLHLHTPSSYDYGDKKVQDEQIISVLRDHGISVVAITDHHVIDVDRIRRLQHLAGDAITILPGIECRTELGGKESIHLIGIFSENSDIERIWNHLRVRLELDKWEGQDPEVAWVEFSKAAATIRELGGIVSVHAGRKSNSIESISNAEAFKRNIKEDLAKKYIDIFEVSSLRDQKDYQDIVMPHLGRSYPVIIGSDNHDIGAYAPKTWCWVKADPTFMGLKQVLNEPIDRIFLGDLPEKLRQVRENPTKFIDRVEIEKLPQSSLGESWFDGTSLELNPGMVAIIGNKGSGKSALVDVIGLLGETKHAGSFSFLTPRKFRERRVDRGPHFVATLQWADGTIIKKRLDEQPQRTAVERVKYIPQQYFEEICNEVGDTGRSRFDEEIEEVLFSHVDVASRLGFGTLRELLAYRTSEIYQQVASLRSELKRLNTEIADLESRLEPEYRQKIVAEIQLKEQELEAHDKAAPEPVEEPPDDDAALAASREELDKERQRQTDLRQQISTLSLELRQVTKQLAVISKLELALANLKVQVENFLDSYRDEFDALGISAQDVITFKLQEHLLVAKRHELLEREEKIRKELDPTVEGSVANAEAVCQERIEALETKLSEPVKRFQQYLEAKQHWEKRRAQIVGDPNSPGSLSYWRHQLAALESIPVTLERAKRQRLKVVAEIHKCLLKVCQIYSELYAPVQRFIDNHPIVKDKGFDLQFEVSIVDSGFHDRFLGLLDQRVAGSFAGAEEGRDRLDRIREKCNFTRWEDVHGFIMEVDDHLRHDVRTPDRRSIPIASQLRKGVRLTDLYDFLYGLEYLQPKYLLKLSGREAHQLSPGERGTLLLVFYLLIDPSDNPLVIDQPEENLDNQTIYSFLVPCMKEAKRRRQVIVVTHNPNLAVVCDAEQIIRCSIDKARGYRITYSAGSIESRDRNKDLLDILEGTRAAFDNRDAKYFADD